MKFYFHINNGKQTIPLTLPENSKSRMDIYNLWGKEFQIGYYAKTYTPNDIYAKPKDDRLSVFIFTLIVVFVLTLITNHLFSLSKISNFLICAFIFFFSYVESIYQYKQEIKKSKEFNTDIDLTNLK